MLIGLDFDNTIACYDRVFPFAAHDMGFEAEIGAAGKEAVKRRLCLQPDGETRWQRVQGRVYGHYMRHAEMFDGFEAFVAKARRQGARLVVMSHKTSHGHFDPDRVDLHQAARAWMRDQGFFAAAGLGFAENEVSFHLTRKAKVAAIAQAGCDAFVDDLPEVLLHPDFPATTRGLLFAPFAGSEAHGLPAYPTWAALAEAVLA